MLHNLDTDIARSKHLLFDFILNHINAFFRNNPGSRHIDTDRILLMICRNPVNLDKTQKLC